MNDSLFIVDAFIGRRGVQTLRGNAAAVVLLNAKRDAEWMQCVAAEMNLSETAFVFASEIDSATGEAGLEAGLDLDFELRWFTPLSEVKLCGHATLAAAHVLWETARVSRAQTIRFRSRSGVLPATVDGEWISMNFPALPSKSVVAPPDLPAALGFSPREPVAIFRAGEDFLVSAPRGSVGTLRPDFAWLRQICLQLRARGVIVTSLPSTKNEAESPGECDFVSRFFAPAIGIDEDPATGSAHAALAPFWSAQLGKTEMTGYQVSRRGGLVRVAVREARVDLGGQCAIFLRGVLEN